MNFRDLNSQYLALKADIDNAMLETAMRGDFISGQSIAELESILADFVGVRHCISCANGTDALTLVLKVWNIGAGDAVFVPNFTFIATAEVVSLEGATPIFVDVDANTFNMCPVSLEKAIQQVVNEGRLKPKVIIPVDLFGLPANFIDIQKVADKYKLLILEDGAQGFGGNIKGKMSCSFGNAATTSFFPAKPLGCYGDGGAIFTNNDEWASLLNSIKVHGKGIDKYDNVRIGLNSRLDTIQAAILKVKQRAFSSYELNKVNDAAQKYSDLLSGIVNVPVIPDGYYSSWAQYTITLKNEKERNDLQDYLKSNGIPSMVYYPKSIQSQTAYTNTGLSTFYTPNTDFLCKTVLSLPMHPYLTNEDIDTVANAIKKFFRNKLNA